MQSVDSPTHTSTVSAPVSRRVAAAVPGIVLLVAFGVFAVTRWGPFESALTSGRALLVLAGIVTAWLVLARFVLPHLVRSPWLRAGLLAVIALAIVTVLVLPYYRNHEVIERFPRAEAAAGAEVPRAERAEAPLRRSTGELHGIDHDATGVASVYERADGTLVVGLEGIDVQNGPDYFVHVVPGSDRDSPHDGVSLGELRGNQGTQYYEVPSGTLVGPDWTVLIWCRTFGVPVANATQTAV